MKMLMTNIETDDHEIFYLRDVVEITRMAPKNKSKEVLVYVTPYGTFTPIVNLEDAEKAYKQFGFKSYDQSHIVNKRKVIETITDAQGKWVIFDDGSKINVSLRTRKK
jgi:hypothetical protein